jgi:hypothetical protein
MGYGVAGDLCGLRCGSSVAFVSSAFTVVVVALPKLQAAIAIAAVAIVKYDFNSDLFIIRSVLLNILLTIKKYCIRPKCYCSICALRITLLVVQTSASNKKHRNV